MARAERVILPAGEVVELTNADVTGNITIQNKSVYAVGILGSTDATLPAVGEFTRAISFRAGDGFQGAFADLFGAGYVRLFAYSELGGAVVVYHE